MKPRLPLKGSNPPIYEIKYINTRRLGTGKMQSIDRPSVRPSVPLSVPLSVTRVDQSKTVTVRITQPSPQSSPMTLVS